MALQSLSAIERYKKKNKASFFPKLPQATRTQVTRIKDNDKTVSFGMSVIGAWDRVVYSFSFEDPVAQLDLFCHYRKVMRLQLSFDCCGLHYLLTK